MRVVVRGLLALAVATTGIAFAGVGNNASALTSASTWAPPTTLTPAESYVLGYEYQLVALPGGGAAAVWGDDSGLQASTRSAAGVWSTPIVISTNGDFSVNDEGTTPTLAVAPSGELIVAWTAVSASETSVIDESTRAPGATTWSAPQTVSPVDHAAAPHLSIGSDGTAALAWEDRSGIEVAMRPSAANSWTEPTLVSDVTEPSALPVAETPRAVVADSGDVVVTWLAPIRDTEWLRGSDWSASTGQWSAPTWISDDTAVDQTFLSTGPDGTVTAGWGGSPKNVASWSNGTWSAPARLFTTTGIDSLASDPSGQTIASGVNDAGQVVVARQNSDGSWSRPVVVGGGAPVQAGDSQAAIGPDGGVTVVWNSYQDDAFALEDASLPAGATSWSAPSRAVPAATDTPDFAVVQSAGGSLDVLADEETSSPTGGAAWSLEADSTVLPQLTVTQPPTITGTPAVRHVLTAHPGSWSETPQNYSYQWRRSGAAIPGATHATFTPDLADAGHHLTVRVTALLNDYRSASATSAAVLIPHPAMDERRAPRITGTARVGRRLDASAGRWMPSPTHVSYRWLRNGHEIQHADHSTYRITRADLHHRLRVRITVSRSGYARAVTTSRLVRVVR